MLTHHTLLLVTIAGGLRVPVPRCAAPRCSAPPALRDADAFPRGELSVDGLGAWWRQDPQLVQVVVRMPEDASFKRDVSIDVSRKRIALAVAGTSVLDGDLAHDVVADASEWFVEDDGMEDFGGGADARYLVVELRKHESYVEWAAPLKGDDDGEGRRRLLIGGQGEAQRSATAQQLASYQVLQKLPSAVRGDVYARVPAGAEEPPTTLYFVGKVIAEAAPAAASLAAQSVLVSEHARRLLPNVFGGVADAEMELWLAPGNSEMAVAQNEVALTRWVSPADDVELPAAGACGFEPETEHANSAPFRVQRDAAGQPIGRSFQANVMKPDEVPGAYSAWLKDQ